MAEDELTANDFISLGSQMLFLSNAKNALGTDYRTSIKEFSRLAKWCRFTGTVAATETFNSCTFYVNSETGFILPNNADQLEFAFQAVKSCLRAEAKKTTIIATSAEPPIDLVNLASRLTRSLEDHQEALRLDLLTCLKARLARPAIVLGWALGYDLVRSWVFHDPQRLTAFNTQLATARRSGGPMGIGDYHDFFRLGEYRLLETCRDSQDASLQRLTERTFRDLQSLLDQRNDFAHANYAHATPTEATAYVERMVRIVTSAPFDT